MKIYLGVNTERNRCCFIYTDGVVSQFGATDWMGNDDIARTCLLKGFIPTGNKIPYNGVYNGTDNDMGNEIKFCFHFDELWEVKEQDDTESQKVLGDCERGSIVKIGDKEYIVLDQSNDTTAVIAKECVDEMKFGNSADYEKSDVRSYCNSEFYEELANIVGKENIIQHTVKLEADDGTGKGKACKDFISIMTTENYRRYRELLEPCDEWWTATKVSCTDSDYALRVCYIGPCGVLLWRGYDYCFGVRPFCILSNKVKVG